MKFLSAGRTWADSSRQNTSRIVLIYGYPLACSLFCVTKSDLKMPIQIDNAMAHILRDRRLALENRLGTKVFSRSSQSDFEYWLSEVEDGMDDFHLAALKTIHPERQE